MVRLGSRRKFNGRSAKLALAGLICCFATQPGLAATWLKTLKTGKYLVGKQVGPGTYQSAGGKNCYWSKNTKTGEIIANELVNGPSILVIDGTEFSVTIKCPKPFKLATKSSSSTNLGAKANGFATGTYLVPNQIPPAVYQSDGGNGCYWSTNTRAGDIIKNELIDGPSVLVIDGTEFSVTIKCSRPFTRSEGATRLKALSTGTYLVGSQVMPGTYQSAGGKSCYWSTNTKAGDIINNELIDGPSILVIDGTEFSVTIKCVAPFVQS
jgi:hypothetical protein